MWLSHPINGIQGDNEKNSVTSRKVLMLLLGCIAIGCVVQAGSALVIAASDSSAASKAQADYICDGVDDQIEIQAALNRLTSGGTVHLAAGTYYCTGPIAPPAHSTLKGDGPDATFIKCTGSSYIRAHAEYVTFEGFHVEGSKFSVHNWYAVIHIESSNVAVRDVTVTGDNTPQAAFLVRSTGRDNKNIANVEFTRCIADYPDTWGFRHDAYETDHYKLQTNITYTDCEAHGCALKTDCHMWAPGFTFNEVGVEVDGLTVTGCTATYNRESGFHIEPMTRVTNAVFVNCYSAYNGQKPYSDIVSPPLNYEGPLYFGGGYYFPRMNNVLIENCVAYRNSQWGFFFNQPIGVTVKNCAAIETGYDRVAADGIIPRDYGILICGPGQDIAITDCLSLNSNGHGLWVTGVSTGVKVKNFSLENPAGFDGVGALLGHMSIYRGLADSEFEIHSSGNSPGLTNMIRMNDGQGVRLTGSVASDIKVPILIAGSATGNALVEGVVTYSNTLPEGSTGIAVAPEVRAGAVTIHDCRVARPLVEPAPTPTSRPTLTPKPTPTPAPTLEPAQKPYKDHTLPGRINFIDFDYGGEGVAYHDTDTGNQGGYTYRTDGADVDIGERDGVDVPVIAHTYAGEWLKYSQVQVGTTGTYDATFYTSTTEDDKFFSVLVDGEKVATINAPNTGSWFAFAPTTVQIPLTAGEHTLQIFMDTGWADMAYVDFKPASVPSEKPDLVVTRIAWSPADPVSGDAVTFQATIKNQGSAPTPAGVNHRVLFTVDDGAAGPGIWADGYTSSIAPGSWVTVTANGGSAGATWEAVEGTHTITAQVDGIDQIAENDESNNAMRKEITIRSQPAPIRGDLNGDGNVDWADVMIIAEMVQGKVIPTEAADFNGDATVDWSDVALLFDFFLGRISSL